MNESFDWMALARDAARRANFNLTPVPFRGESFSLGGDFSPNVQVFFQHVTDRDIAPDAWLGWYAEDFEREWRERLLRAGLPPTFLDDPPFCTSEANIAALRPRPWVPPTAPSDEDIASMQAWWDRAFEYSSRLPRSLSELVSAISAPDTGGRPAWMDPGHPVKARGFVQWMRRTHGVDLAEQVRRHLTDRTYPYDLGVMLDGPGL